MDALGKGKGSKGKNDKGLSRIRIGYVFDVATKDTSPPTALRARAKVLKIIIRARVKDRVNGMAKVVARVSGSKKGKVIRILRWILVRRDWSRAPTVTVGGLWVDSICSAAGPPGSC